MRKLFPLIVGTCLSVPTMALAADAPKAAPAAVVASANQVQTASTPAPARAENMASDKARYSAKENEKAAAQAQDYKGGDTVVIGASAATAILAVLLLIVLI